MAFEDEPRANGSGADHFPKEALLSPPVASVVVRKALSQAPRMPHVIAFANEKGGVGKSTLAFHAAVALCHSGARVLALDLDHRQRSFTQSHEMREVTARTLRIDLPCTKFLTIEKQSGAYIEQEIKRVGRQADFVVMDLPGADTLACRYALAIADTIVTPVGASCYDLGGLGRVSPSTKTLIEAGCFGSLVQQIREERTKIGLPAGDWIVMKNRFRTGERRLEAWVNESLESLSERYGFRIGTGLHESISFRDLNAYGLTYLDIGLISALGRRNRQSEDAIAKFLLQLRLPGFEDASADLKRATRSRPLEKAAPIAPKDARDYEQALRHHKRNS